jgi:hypothetical protein
LEKKFYKVEKYTFVKDIKKYLEGVGLNYEKKFFNQNKKYKYDKAEGDRYSKIVGSITLIAYSEKYPVGYYLLRVKNGWVDPWINFPSKASDRKAGVRKKLPGKAWYVLYPKS